MNDEVEGATGPEDGFERGLADRLSAAAAGVDRAPSRAGVDGAVGVLVARQRRVRRVGALVAAAAVLAVGGIAVAGAGDDGGASVEVAAGSSTTEGRACPDDLDGGQLFEVGDGRCGPPVCTDPSTLVLDGIQVAYGYDWGIDLATGDVRVLDHPFGPNDVRPGLVVLTPQQGSILLEDSVLTVVPRTPEEQVGLVVTREVALDLVAHGEPITAAQLVGLRHPAGGAGTAAPQAVFAPGDGSRGGCDEPAPTSTVVEATSTTTPPSTTTSTVPATTSTAPEATTTSTTTAAPAHPPALLDLVEGGTAWAVYLVVADGADGSIGPTLDAARARAQAEGYHAEFVNLACDRGAAAGLGLDPADPSVGMALYFTDGSAATAAAALFDDQVRGPVQVRTHCVDTELDGTPAGESGDSDREQSAPFP